MNIDPRSRRGLDRGFWPRGEATPSPCSAYPEPEDARALVVVVPLTSQLRGLRGEVDIGKPRWLPKRSAVNIQGFASVDQHALIRKLGKLSDGQFLAVKNAIREMLGL